MLKWIYYILISITFLLGAGTLLQVGYVFFHSEGPVHQHPRDTYDPALGRLNSLNKLEYFVDSLASEKSLTVDSIPEYINLVDSIVRMRFYYGLQNYRFSENYLANLAGKYIWSHFGAKVEPDHILDGQKAFCSQSSIVFQELLRRKDFNVRSVILANHFCTEVLVNGSWQFHDVSYKPELSNLGSLSAEDLASNPHYRESAYLYTFAEDFRTKLETNFSTDNISYGEMNVFAASNMAIFHKITYFLSWWGWLVFFLVTIIWRKIFLINVKN